MTDAKRLETATAAIKGACRGGSLAGQTLDIPAMAVPVAG